MKPFKAIIVAKHSPVELWIAVRDRMPDVAAFLDDVESVRVLERRSNKNGDVHLVNEWKVKPGLGVPVGKLIDPTTLGWHDHAEWIEAERLCRWRIEPLFLQGRIRCHGVTTYESAMGGRGSRVTFQGEIDLDMSKLVGSSRVFDGGITVAVETIVTTLIPRNFRKTIDAAGKLLAGGARLPGRKRT